MADNDPLEERVLNILSGGESTKQEQSIENLEKSLELERDGRKEDRFVGIVLLILLLDVVFFSVMPSFGGPIALLILELLILIPLARSMGVQNIAVIISSVLHRMAGNVGSGSE